MLLSVFRVNYAFINLLLAILVAALWCIPFAIGYTPSSDAEQPLLTNISFNGLNAQTLIVMGAIACYTQSILINTLFNRSGVFNRSSSLPGLVFICLKIIDPNAFSFHASDLLLISLIGGAIPLVYIKRESSALLVCFTFGLLVALGSIFFFPGIFLLILPWVFLSFIRPFNLREYLGPFIGALVVFAFIFTYQLFQTNGALHFTAELVDQHKFPIITPKEISFIIIVLFSALMLLGARYFVKSSSNATVHFRKISRSVAVFVLTLLLWAVVISLHVYGGLIIVFVALWASMLMPFYLQEPRRAFWQNLLFHVWFTLIIVQHFI